MAQHAVATILVPKWESSTWWHLVVPDASHLSDWVVDWVWLPRAEKDLFLGGTAPGRSVYPPDWPVMAIRVDFSGKSRRGSLSKRDRCIHGGCGSCRSLSWRRQK